MYEIWLVMNIVWEIARGIWPALLAAALIWLLLMGLASRRSAATWWAVRWPALGLSLVAAVLAFVSVPSLTQSSLREMSYWVDWVNLLAIAAAAAGLALAFAWPLLAWRRSS